MRLRIAALGIAILIAGCASAPHPSSPSCTSQTLYLGPDGFTTTKPTPGYYNFSWPLNPVWASSDSTFDLQVPLHAIVPGGATHQEFQIRIVSKSGAYSQVPEQPFQGLIVLRGHFGEVFAFPAYLQPGKVYGQQILTLPFPSGNYTAPSLTFQSLYYTVPPAMDLSLASWPGHFDSQSGHELDTHIIDYYCPVGSYPPNWPPELGGNGTATSRVVSVV